MTVSFQKKILGSFGYQSLLKDATYKIAVTFFTVIVNHGKQYLWRDKNNKICLDVKRTVIIIFIIGIFTDFLIFIKPLSNHWSGSVFVCGL